jgi:hypothetical protein
MLVGRRQRGLRDQLGFIASDISKVAADEALVFVRRLP